MERFILDTIAKSTNIVFNNFAIALHLLGTAGIAFVVLGLILIIKKETRPMGFHIILSLILCLVFGNIILKPSLARTRPFIKYKKPILISPPKDYSFPSGHTYASFATAFSIRSYNKSFSNFMLILASLFAFSRLYLYVHYPTDILGGIVLGYICSKLSEKIIKKFFSKKSF
ncbi:phosphatase PAP2 family protein [Peptoniphilus catoniae]|uniref:phosphatase PAP2 family protein n=1 Tax=Peptoniphilus catoniae TaxID=1660341 RepID=UPI0015D5DFFC|nr:phosphatase PAP2 family protein [Peptoniphilus catoniae]